LADGIETLSTKSLKTALDREYRRCDSTDPVEIRIANRTIPDFKRELESRGFDYSGHPKRREEK
jgi:hypothetical protein